MDSRRSLRSRGGRVEDVGGEGQEYGPDHVGVAPARQARRPNSFAARSEKARGRGAAPRRARRRTAWRNPEADPTRRQEGEHQRVGAYGEGEAEQQPLPQRTVLAFGEQPSPGDVPSPYPKTTTYSAQREVEEPDRQPEALLRREHGAAQKDDAQPE